MSFEKKSAKVWTLSKLGGCQPLSILFCGHFTFLWTNCSKTFLKHTLQRLYPCASIPRNPWNFGGFILVQKFGNIQKFKKCPKNPLFSVKIKILTPLLVLQLLKLKKQKWSHNFYFVTKKLILEPFFILKLRFFSKKSESIFWL